MSERPAPSPPVQLTDGNPRDLDSVIKIMDAAFDDRFGEAWTRSQCAGILPMPGVRLVLARSETDQPLGFSLFRTVADDAELLLLAVAPEYRRQGVGRLLLNQFIEHAQHQGASRVHLEVREGNPAVAMYRAAGFRCAGRRRKYYKGRSGGEFDALTLVKRI